MIMRDEALMIRSRATRREREREREREGITCRRLLRSTLAFMTPPPRAQFE